nr:uncharacterized protein LOC127309586 [Lolium perenne]
MVSPDPAGWSVFSALDVQQPPACSRSAAPATDSHTLPILIRRLDHWKYQGRPRRRRTREANLRDPASSSPSALPRCSGMIHGALLGAALRDEGFRRHGRVAALSRVRDRQSTQSLMEALWVLMWH